MSQGAEQAVLITLQGPSVGRYFPFEGEALTVGRQADCAVCLESPAVSRQHARIVREGGLFYVEDLGSSNGTYLNGERISDRRPLTEQDSLQVGPYQFALRLRLSQGSSESAPIVRSQVNALSSNQSLYAQNAAQKLKVFVEIAQGLGRTLDVKPLLEKLLEQLFRLFPQADRGMVIITEDDQFFVRAQRLRHRPSQSLAATPVGGEGTDTGVLGQAADFPFSRSLVKRALDDGVGLLSEDVGGDPSLPKTATLLALNLRSFLCVPLIGLDQRRLGVLQLDCVRQGMVFRHDDLELLTALALQVAVVLENAALHEERLREERLRQEIALARDIQQSFLPRDFAPASGGGYELYARVHPAREVSGDLYDFFPQPDGRLALFLGDVSGKGVPAALYMIAVRTLARHLAASVRSPGEMLQALNNALVADNPTSLYVTLIHALFDPRTGELALVSGGHPAPLLRRSGGAVEPVAVRSVMMLGYAPFDDTPRETRLSLQPGEMVLLYTDGLTEAFKPDRKSMFGADRLREVFARVNASRPLEEIAEEVRAAITRFTAQPELQDDQTLLLLRRI